MFDRDHCRGFKHSARIHALFRWTTLGYAEKVRSQVLSLRQIGLRGVFSERFRWQFSPISKAISNLSSELLAGEAPNLFSERPVSLRTSGLRKFSTVLKIRLFRAAYGLQRKEVGEYLLNRREPPISKTNRCVTQKPSSNFAISRSESCSPSQPVQRSARWALQSGLCELAQGLWAPDCCFLRAKQPIVSGGHLKNSHFLCPIPHP